MTSQVIGPALFVLHGKTEALIWLPRKEQHFFINDENVGSYKLGDWVLFDYNREKIIEKQKETPYETKVLYSKVVKQRFVQIKVPLVFFSDKQSSEVVAYSPGFGRVGAFVPNLAMDTMCFAWIAFAGFFKNAELRSLMATLELKWLIAEVDRLMTKSEIIEFPGKLGLSNSFNRCFGIVIGREFRDGKQNNLVVKFFTASNGLCEYCMPIANDQQPNFHIGSWARFLPIRNYSNQFTAVNASTINTPNGISLIEKEPQIKLSLFHDLFHLDQDPYKNIIHAQFLGELHSTDDFVWELRKKRQKYALFRPRLFVTFDSTTNRWVPTHFDDQESVPLPSTSQATKTAEVQPQNKNSEGILGKPRLNDGADFGDGPKNFQPSNRENEKKKSFVAPVENRPRTWAPAGGKKDFKARNSLPNDNRKVNGRFASSVAQRPTLHQNLQGLVVSVSSNSNVLFVYTCQFPSDEFSINRSEVSIPEGVRHGSWVTFDLKTESNGEKKVIRCDLDKSPPNWAVTPIRNTVQIELTAFVPRKWRPEIIAPESRIVPTNWFDEMLDFGMLLTEDMADKSVKVLAERNQHSSGKTWHLVKVLGVL
ncbi:hypothetical protein niasHS_007446 [Heterodera schachtii]|uniref:Uncharacterized protein n=1 Tax=Heterodera schachtii TaxID=97005 RepID=A0ABD2JXI1_HETSC